MAMANANSKRSSAMSDVFTVPFHISSALLIGYLQSNPRSHYLRVLAPTLVHLWNISPHPLQIFNSSALLIEGLNRFCQEDSMRLISGVR